MTELQGKEPAKDPLKDPKAAANARTANVAEEKTAETVDQPPKTPEEERISAVAAGDKLTSKIKFPANLQSLRDGQFTDHETGLVYRPGQITPVQEAPKEGSFLWQQIEASNIGPIA